VLIAPSSVPDITREREIEREREREGGREGGTEGGSESEREREKREGERGMGRGRADETSVKCALPQALPEASCARPRACSPTSIPQQLDQEEHAMQLVMIKSRKRCSEMKKSKRRKP
jgi:hypothetical protein